MKAKKVLALVLCAALLVAGSVAATLAYLTSKTEVVTNTFSVGNVTITLDEAKVNEYGVEAEGEDRVKANEYKLIPGHTYTKDPIIHVAAGSEACYVFVKVENGIKDIEIAAANGDTIEEQMKAKGWKSLSGGVWYKEAAVDARQVAVDVEVFDTFTVANEADVSGYVTETNAAAVIKVTGYAVQADGFADALDAWDKAPCTAW